MPEGDMNFGAKDLMRLSTFSARVETVTTKPFFREAFKRTRCLIPASGYQEWQDGDGIAVRECRQQTSATIDRPRRSGQGTLVRTTA
jgi:putative SOS response-associated peptidase YedK